MFRAGTECPWPVRRIAEDYFDEDGVFRTKVLNGTSGAGDDSDCDNDGTGKVEAAGGDTAASTGTAETVTPAVAATASIPTVHDNIRVGVGETASTNNETANATTVSTGTPASTVPVGTSAPAGAADRQQAAAQSLGDLLTAGATFLHELGQSLRQGTASETTQGTAATSAPTLTSLIGTDEATGQRYVKLPLPQNTESLLRLTELLQTILKR